MRTFLIDKISTRYNSQVLIEEIAATIAGLIA